MSEANQLIEELRANQLVPANQLIALVVMIGKRRIVCKDLSLKLMLVLSYDGLRRFLKGGSKMDMIMKLALPIIMQIVEQLLSPENIRKYGDNLFDFIEDAVASSKTTIDDTTVLPLIRALREGLSIPDND